MWSRKPTWFAVLATVILIIPALFSVLPSASAADDVDDLESDIKGIEKKIEKEQTKKEAIKSELSSINSSLTMAQRAINETQGHIEQTEEEINRKQEAIAALEGEMERHKVTLRGLLVDAYYDGVKLEFPELLSEDDFLGALTSPERYQTIGERIRAVITRIDDAKLAVETERARLESYKDEKENLLKLKQDQKYALVVEQRSTQSDLAKQEATIGELQAKLGKLRSSLSELLGKSYDAKDIEDAAKFASKMTGVRKDFIMGMLVVESDLGRYTGGCTYEEVEKGAEKAYKSGKLSKTSWNTFLRRKEIFKDIADELDRNYKKLKVSCNPSSYAGTGGAMGVAQFMPDTWMSYRNSIMKATGSKHPDPWNLTDGVTAMAIKLAKVPGVTDHKKSAERNAAKLYLSGTTSSKYDWYAAKVLYWADNYERLLD